MARSLPSLRVLGLIGALAATTASAQDRPTAPKVTGTLTYNFVLLSRPAGAQGRPGTGRFAGRLAVRIQPRIGIGFMVGSWVRERTPSCASFPQCANLLTAYSDVLVHQIFGQIWLRDLGAFVRAGVGLAWRSEFTASGGTIVTAKDVPPVTSLGAGWDLRMAPHLFLTPSVDVIWLLGGNRESVTWGAAFGLGLTVR